MRLAIFSIFCLLTVQAAIEQKYNSMTALDLKREVTVLEKQKKFLEEELATSSGVATPGKQMPSIPKGEIDPKYSSTDALSLKRLATKLDSEVQQLQHQLGVTPLSTPVKTSPAPTVVFTAGAASGRADLDDILHKLDDVSREVRALRVHSDITPSNLSGAFDQHATADDRSLDLAFKDSSLVEAYKAAKKANSLAGFWPVVKAQVLKKLEAKVNELQPGGNNSILLVQYSNNMIGYMVGAKLKEVTKEEFLRDLNLRIQALTFDGITIPIDKNVEQFRASYIGKINIAIASQIDDLVAGNADTVILQEDVARNIKGTNLAPKSKNAFRYILQEAVK